MANESESRLREIVKGSAKGLVGTLCVLPFGLGLPAADGLYNSIETNEGKLAYSIVGETAIGVQSLWASGIFPHKWGRWSQKRGKNHPCPDRLFWSG